MPYRDREEPHSSLFPHHAGYGSVLLAFDFAKAPTEHVG